MSKRPPHRPRREPIRASHGLVLDWRSGSVAVKPLDRAALIERVAEAIENEYAHGIVTLSTETAKALLRL